MGLKESKLYLRSSFFGFVVQSGVHNVRIAYKILNNSMLWVFG